MATECITKCDKCGGKMTSNILEGRLFLQAPHSHANNEQKRLELDKDLCDKCWYELYQLLRGLFKE